MSERREGRGQLSSIDRLPEEAEDIVLWAMGELAERRRPQTHIHAEFNDKLVEIGEGPISWPAFNRRSVKQAILLRRQEESRNFVAALSENADLEAMDDLNLVASQAVSMLALKALTSIDEPDAKEVLFLLRKSVVTIGHLKTKLTTPLASWSPKRA